MLSICSDVVAQMVKNLPTMRGDRGSIPRLRRSPGEGNGNPLQYSCLVNSMDRGTWRATVHGAAKSQTTEWLTLHFNICTTGCLPHSWGYWGRLSPGYLASPGSLFGGFFGGEGSLMNLLQYSVQFSSVQSLSRVRLFANPWITACQASLSITNSWSLSKPMSIELVMASSHLILCRPLLLPPTILPSIRSFPMSQLFISGGQSIGVAASTSVPPMNT